jgi:superfamily II DNA helicase RecQ
MAAPINNQLDFTNSLNLAFDLKEKQVEALRALYHGQDTVAMLPTGYGKSVTSFVVAMNIDDIDKY